MAKTLREVAETTVKVVSRWEQRLGEDSPMMAAVWEGIGDFAGMNGFTLPEVLAELEQMIREGVTLWV